jgi:hypothetical protein
MHVYEIRPRKDKRGFDLISDALPPSFVLAIGWCVVLLNGAIVAMSFLPPVRDVFATSDLTNR